MGLGANVTLYNKTGLCSSEYVKVVTDPPLKPVDRVWPTGTTDLRFWPLELKANEFVCVQPITQC